MGGMGKMNVGRIVLGGVVAGVLLFVLDGVVHGVLLKGAWTDVMAALGRKPGETSSGFATFAVYDLGKGLLTALVYAAIRPRFGAGPATAGGAGLLTWLLAIPLPLVGLLPMEFFSSGFVALWSLYTLIPMVIAGVVSGALYRE